MSLSIKGLQLHKSVFRVSIAEIAVWASVLEKTLFRANRDVVAGSERNDKSRTHVGISCPPPSLVSFHSLKSLCELCVFSPATGGCYEMRGEHRPQLPLSLAGVGRLCLRTLSEGHRVVPPQRHVNYKVSLSHTHTRSAPCTKDLTASDCVYTRLHWAFFHKWPYLHRKKGFPRLLCFQCEIVYSLSVVRLWHTFDTKA